MNNVVNPQAENLAKQFTHFLHEFLTPPGGSDLVSLNRGQERRIIMMPMDFSRKSMPEQELYGGLKKAEVLLQQSPITDSFREHLLDSIHFQADTETARLPLSGLFGECGIDIGKKEWGIFDPAKAKEIEAKAIRENNPNPYLEPDLAEIHNKMMDRWIAEFREKYGEDPLN